jgi:hypothetical protein
MVCFLENSATFLAAPAESRKAWASNVSGVSFFLDFILLERIASIAAT